jgi:hypothetical protein
MTIPIETATPPPEVRPPPRKKRHRGRKILLILGGLFAAFVALVVVISLATAHTAAAPKAASAPTASASASAAPATPAQPATASGYLTAHGYTVVQHFSRAKWLSMLTPGTAYAPYVAAGSDVAADGIKGSQVEFAIKVSNPTAASDLAPSSMTLDGTYLVGSTTLSTASPAAAPSTPAAAPSTSAPAAAVGTVSQQQALQSAQSYLAMGSGFSQAGLIAQLDSPYGGQFSVADATWAADNSGADWNAQAVLAAKGYMQSVGGFSRDSLIAQLDSPYGGQFTLAQATYAAGQVGL